MTTATTTTRELTVDQKALLAWMDDAGIGALAFEGDYRFPVHFRKDAELASRYVAKRRAAFYAGA